MVDRLFDVYTDIVELLTPEIEYVVEFSNCDKSKLISCSDRKLFSVSCSDLGGFDFANKLNAVCAVYNGCSGFTDDFLGYSANDFVQRMMLFGVEQIVLTGFAVPDDIMRKPIGVSDAAVNQFYDYTLNDERVLNKYAQSVQSVAQSEKDLCMSDLIQFALRYLSKSDWETAVQKNYTPYSIEELYSAIQNQSNYRTDHFDYLTDDYICRNIYDRLGIWIDYPIRYKISLVKSNLK